MQLAGNCYCCGSAVPIILLGNATFAEAPRAPSAAMKHFGALILLLGIAAQPSASEAAAAATATPGAASVAPTVAVVPATSLANAEWPEGYLAVCFVVKNQHEDLKEWLTYQEYIGVSRVRECTTPSTLGLLLLAICLYFGQTFTEDLKEWLTYQEYTGVSRVGRQ